jgi:hypothetical protein
MSHISGDPAIDFRDMLSPPHGRLFNELKAGSNSRVITRIWSQFIALESYLCVLVWPNCTVVVGKTLNFVFHLDCLL